MSDNTSIENIINHDSVDDYFYYSLSIFIKLLNDLDIEYYIIGSLGIQSYLKYLRRIPNDIDITISDEDINKITNYCSNSNEFYFEEHFLASKIFIKGISSKHYLHLIPNNMRILDKKKNTIFQNVNIYFPNQISYNKITFLGNSKELLIKVPTLEYMFCFNLFGQLDTNTINDSISILNQNEIDKSIINTCIDNLSIMKPILISRINNLKKVLLHVQPDLFEKI